MSISWCRIICKSSFALNFKKKLKSRVKIRYKKTDFILFQFLRRMKISNFIKYKHKIIKMSHFRTVPNIELKISNIFRTCKIHTKIILINFCENINSNLTLLDVLSLFVSKKKNKKVYIIKFENTT